MDPLTRRLVDKIEVLGNAFENMDSKLSGMKEGEVLTRGIAQKRSLITQTMRSELDSDSTAKRKFGESLNLK